MPIKKEIRKWRLSGQPEQFHVEVITLHPIAIEDPDRALMEAGEAAEVLGVTRATMTGYLDRGTLRAIRRSGSTRRWLLRDEVMAMAAQRGNDATARPEAAE